MMRAGSELRALIGALRGQPLVGTDWQSVIALANHALLTPALFSSLAQAGRLDGLPEDVRDYLRFIHDCNRERNLRLREQLYEAVTVLNSHGIVPLLLKGAVPLFLAPTDRLPSRMTSDLDIAVDGAEHSAAQACLEGLGYVPMTDGRELARPKDAGVLELRSSQISAIHPPKLVRRDGLRAWLPSTQSLALHWILHDLMKEGDYWRGRIGLRHLYDLAQLAESDQLDWHALRNSMHDRSARNAIDTQLCTLKHLFGVSVPEEYVRHPFVRFQHWRRVVTASHPVMGIPLRLSGNLVWGAWKLLHAGDRLRRNPIDVLRRGVRVLMDRDHRSKI